MTGRPRWWPAGAALAAVLTVAGCSPARRAAGGPRPAPSAPAGLYVAVGASETRGVGTDNPLRESWPQVLFGALPAGYSFVNLGISGATVAQALTDELPIAVALHPTLVTVWLNVDDLLSGVPASRYEADLFRLVAGLRATGARVLVANTPPLDELPAYLVCSDPAHHPGSCDPAVPRPVPGPATVDAAVDAYNAAIARVSAANGAVVVDLHALGLQARTAGTASSLVSADGFHPSDRGAAAVGDLFAATWRGAAGGRGP